MRHAERPEHVAGRVAQEVLSRGGFDHRRDQVPAVGRVGKLRARGEQQRIVLKNGESLEHGAEVAVEQEFIPPIMANPGQVPGELPRGDRDAFIGKRRDVTLHRRVEVELPLLVQQRHRRRGDRLGHAADAELRLRRDGNLAGDIGVAEALRPHQLAVHAHGHLEAADAARQLGAHQGASPRHGRAIGRRHRHGRARYTLRLTRGAAVSERRCEQRRRDQHPDQ